MQRPLPLPPGATDLALTATPSASYTSPWTTITAINNGIYPIQSSDDNDLTPYWGTWPMAGSQYMELDWSQPVTTNASSVYFADDGGGLQLPASWVVQYWNGTQFVDVTGASSYPEARQHVQPGDVRPGDHDQAAGGHAVRPRPRRGRRHPVGRAQHPVRRDVLTGPGPGPVSRPRLSRPVQLGQRPAAGGQPGPDPGDVGVVRLLVGDRLDGVADRLRPTRLDSVASSSAMSLTSLSVSWLPSKANSGM